MPLQFLCHHCFNLSQRENRTGTKASYKNPLKRTGLYLELSAMQIEWCVRWLGQQVGKNVNLYFAITLNFTRRPSCPWSICLRWGAATFLSYARPALTHSTYHAACRMPSLCGSHTVHVLHRIEYSDLYLLWVCTVWPVRSSFLISGRVAKMHMTGNADWSCSTCSMYSTPVFRLEKYLRWRPSRGSTRCCSAHQTASQNGASALAMIENGSVFSNCKLHDPVRADLQENSAELFDHVHVGTLRTCLHFYSFCSMIPATHFVCYDHKPPGVSTCCTWSLLSEIFHDVSSYEVILTTRGKLRKNREAALPKRTDKGKQQWWHGLVLIDVLTVFRWALGLNSCTPLGVMNSWCRWQRDFSLCFKSIPIYWVLGYS